MSILYWCSTIDLPKRAGEQALALKLATPCRLRAVSLNHWLMIATVQLPVGDDSCQLWSAGDSPAGNILVGQCGLQHKSDDINGLMAELLQVINLKKWLLRPTITQSNESDR